MSLRLSDFSRRWSSNRMPMIVAFCLAICGCVLASPAFAQSSSAKSRSKLPYTVLQSNGVRQTIRSQNFIVHTDLDQEGAADLIDRLETMQGLIAAYYKRRLPSPIECYVVQDLGKWKVSDFPDNYGYAKIAEGAGVTVSQVLRQGNRFLAEAVVYADAGNGTPQHEAVHAFCSKTFGRTGPIWYSEGMAEVGNYWRKGQIDVQLPDVVEKYLQDSEPKSLNAIVNNDDRTGDSWQNYAWRWALCHLLEFNPNYHDRFLPLGLALLNETPNVTFESVYGDMADEVSFEYKFFLKHMGNGFRVDLCAWDWKKKSVPLVAGRKISARVLAQRGWQAAGATLVKGRTYEYDASGTWKIADDAAVCDAQGDSDGRGRLVGVMMKDFELGEPFELGPSGTFVAPQDGQLYLRCQEEWTKLADNKGQITVRLGPK